jgi:hypothetical protein
VIDVPENLSSLSTEQIYALMERLNAYSRRCDRARLACRRSSARLKPAIGHRFGPMTQRRWRRAHELRQANAARDVK